MMTLPQFVGFRGRPASALWTPAQWGGSLWAWYDAPTQGGSNGVAVPQMTDRSANGRHLTTGTGNGQPTYSATGFGGYPGFSFAGSRGSEGLHAISASEVTWFMAVKTAVGPGAFPRILSHDNADGNDWNTGELTLLQYAGTGNPTIGGPGTTFTEASPAIAAGSLCIFAFRTANASQTLWNNSTQVATQTPAAGTPNSPRVRFGSYAASNQYTDAIVAEAFAHTGALTTLDRQKAEGYLAHKYGLTANLPAGHPYKTTPP